MKPEAHVGTDAYNARHPVLANPGENHLMPHMPQLDGIRAIAVLLVIWHHFMPASVKMPQGPAWGAIGVGMFFTLSGFLITRILLVCRLKIDEKSATIGGMLKQFYVRRALRIFPLYYGVLIVLAVFNTTNIRDRIWWNLGYLSNVRFSLWRDTEPMIERHLWSLSVEEQFYLVWPLLMFLVPRRLLLPLILLAIAMGPVWRAYTYKPGLLRHEWMTPGCLDLLGFGALLALLSLPQFRLNKLWNGAIDFFGLIGVPLFFLFVGTKLVSVLVASGDTVQWITATVPSTLTNTRLKSQWIGLGMEWPDYGGITYLVTAIFSFWLIGSAARGFRGLIGWILTCPPLVYIGRISYGLYVIHMFVPHLMDWLFPGRGFEEKHTWGHLFLHTSVSVALASVSWYAFEAPINRLKKYFEYNKTKRDVLPPIAAT